MKEQAVILRDAFNRFSLRRSGMNPKLRRGLSFCQRGYNPLCRLSLLNHVGYAFLASGNADGRVSTVRVRITAVRRAM